MSRGPAICGRCVRKTYVSLGIRYCRGCNRRTFACACALAGTWPGVSTTFQQKKAVSGSYQDCIREVIYSRAADTVAVKHK